MTVRAPVSCPAQPAGVGVWVLRGAVHTYESLATRAAHPVPVATRPDRVSPSDQLLDRVVDHLVLVELLAHRAPSEVLPVTPTRPPRSYLALARYSARARRSCRVTPWRVDPEHSHSRSRGPGRIAVRDGVSAQCAPRRTADLDGDRTFALLRASRLTRPLPPSGDGSLSLVPYACPCPGLRSAPDSFAAGQESSEVTKLGHLEGSERGLALLGSTPGVSPDRPYRVRAGSGLHRV